MTASRGLLRQNEVKGMLCNAVRKQDQYIMEISVLFRVDHDYAIIK